jgi:hypothetical protein
MPKPKPKSKPKPKKSKKKVLAPDAEPFLFVVPPKPEPEIRVAPVDRPLWTGSKAKLIQRYIKLFIMITHHGNYIDGFAGPQSAENREDMWSAKLVLELEPKWLRRFFLCDISREQYKFLQELKKAHADRDVRIKRADCNIWLPEIVKRNQTQGSDVLSFGPTYVRMPLVYRRSNCAAQESRKQDRDLLLCTNGLVAAVRYGT